MIRAPKSVYLAGQITGLTFDEAADWRNLVKGQLAEHGIEGLSPLCGKEYLREIGVLGCDGDRYGVYGLLSTNKGITQRDRWDAQRCDVLLVNLMHAPKASIGTVMEIAWADACRKPIVLAMEPGNVHEHGMILEVTGYRCVTLDEAVQTVISILR